MRQRGPLGTLAGAVELRIRSRWPASRRSGFSGPITGVDQSPVLLDAARRLATEEGVGERIEFVAGDAHTRQSVAASASRAPDVSQ